MCKSKRAQFWTDKLNREAKCHPYTLFGTLTYAPEFLPTVSLDSEIGCLVSSDGTFCVKSETVNDYLDYDSKRYIDLCSGYLPYFRSSDLQAFIKRLRSRVRNNPSGESKSCRYVRYFFCFEYGETKLRPHAHFLIFTGSKWFAEHQTDVVASCWSTDGRYSYQKQLGRIDCEIVKSSASSYVASYLTCTDRLPKIYRCRELRPSALFSKLPSLGSLLCNNEEVQELFNSGSVYRTIHRKDGSVLQVLWSADICNRLYPRVYGFGRVSPDVIRRLYEYSPSFVGESFDEFFWHCKRLAESPDYVDLVCGKNVVSCPKYDFGLKYYFRQVLSECENSQDNSVLRHLFSVLNRLNLQSVSLHCDINEYTNRILDYWQRRDYALLKFQCHWQSDVSSRDKSLRDFSLVSIDPEFSYRNTLDKNFNRKDYFHESLCSLSCIVDRSADVGYVDKVALSHKIITDGKNKHIKYEYLEKDKIDVELKKYYKYLISKKLA